jgi:DNA-binding transcriptional LysR family regulator
MSLRPLFDLDLLRTLVFVADEGSFTKAALRVGITQSAVSLQIQKLEAVVRQPLVARFRGGGVELTLRGRALAARAREMLAINDEAFREIVAADASTIVRLGTSTSYAPYYLAKTLERVRAEQPSIQVEVVEAYSCQLAPRIGDEAFDLIICEANHEPRQWPAQEVWRAPLKWIGASNGAAHRRRPLPLCLTPRDCPWRPAWMEDCFWRTAPMHTLERAGQPFSIVATANSMEGLYAPVIEDEAVTVSMGGALPTGLRVLDEDDGLPPLPDCGVILIKGRRAVQPQTDILAAAILAEFRVA